jgi:anaerobic ribonucleoside-triphosphate reductase
MIDELVEEIYGQILERNNIKSDNKCDNRETKVSEEERRFGEGIGFQRLRRITGYLVGTVDRWNNGKRAELSDRVKHL